MTRTWQGWNSVKEKDGEDSKLLKTFITSQLSGKCKKENNRIRWPQGTKKSPKTCKSSGTRTGLINKKQALVSARTITKIKCYKDGEVKVQLTRKSSL